MQHYITIVQPQLTVENTHGITVFQVIPRVFLIIRKNNRKLLVLKETNFTPHTMVFVSNFELQNSSGKFCFPKFTEVRTGMCDVNINARYHRLCSMTVSMKLPFYHDSHSPLRVIFKLEINFLTLNVRAFLSLN